MTRKQCEIDTNWLKLTEMFTKYHKMSDNLFKIFYKYLYPIEIVIKDERMTAKQWETDTNELGIA